MKKRKTILKKFNPTIVTIIVFILLSIFIIKGNEVLSSNRKEEVNSETEYSAYPGVDIITDIYEEDTQNVAIHYPSFNDNSLNAEISDYIYNSKNEFLNNVDNNQEYLKKYPATLNISFDIHPFYKDMYSIVFSSESYVTGANGMQKSRVFLLDVKKNQFINQREILNDNEKNRDKLYNLLLKEFEKSEKYNQFLFNDYLKDWVFDKDNSFENMFLTEEFLSFKFDKYMVTAGVAGTPEINIPLNKVDDLISNDWKEIIKINSQEKTTPPNIPEEIDEIESENKDNENKIPSKQVAITFDDGPHPVNTLSILRLLDEYNAKATFFMLGSKVDFYPDVTREVSKNDHELGNHTWNHKKMTSLGKEEIELEIQKTNEAIIAATGGKGSTVFRPPYGAINDEVRDIVKMQCVLWTIDTMDWKSHNPDEVLGIVKENITDGSVLLMHDIHNSTVEAVELILKFLKDEGYEFVTVSELNSN